jgi:hypothetical protein
VDGSSLRGRRVPPRAGAGVVSIWSAALSVRTRERLLALARVQGSGIHVERAERHLRELGASPR